jgi:FixJ family two-component response regulator
MEKIRPANCDLLITDIRMPEMDGLELITRVRQVAPLMPILVITGYGDIPLAVKVIKAGVLDILEKPFAEQDLISKVDAALERSRKIKSMLSEKLTRTETEVLKLILHGKSNKEAAKLLNRSVRTVEDHRAHIMKKMNVENAVDLAIKAVALGLVDDEITATVE